MSQVAAKKAEAVRYLRDACTETKAAWLDCNRCKRCSEPASLDAVKYTRLSFRQANDETLIHTYRPNLKSKGTVEAFGPREKGYEVVSRRLCLLMHNSKKGIRGFMRY